MKKTLVVNLFAGPGAGKSTAAAYLFSKLKMDGFDCELVTEYAKDKVWEKNNKALGCQFYVTGKQAFKIFRCVGEVDIVITDSPIITGCFYNSTETLNKAILEEANKYDNLNIFLERDFPYQQNGRIQSEKESLKLDQDIKDFLVKEKVPFETFKSSLENMDKIYKRIVQVKRGMYYD